MTSVLLLVGVVGSILMYGAGSIARVRSTGEGREFSRWGTSLSLAAMILLLVNLNMWLPGVYAWGIVMAIAVGAVAWSWAKTGTPFSGPVIEASVASGLTSVALTALWLRMFGTQYLWLLQGDGNDLLYFFGGAGWAAEHGLFVPQSVVSEGMHLGTCNQGAIIVGRDCAVYRGGTYTLMALVSSVFPDASANEFRGVTGIAGPLLVAGFLPAIFREPGVRLFDRIDLPRWLVCTAAAILVGASTGMVGAVANGNMGTVFGASVLVMLTAWAATDCEHAGMKAAALGLGAGIATHVYGEAAVYACFVVAAGVAADALKLRQPSWIVVGGVVSLLCFAVAANLVLIEVYSSLVAISDLVAAGKWRAWYLGSNPVTWMAAPFAGIQMDGDLLVQPLDLRAGFVLAAGLAVLSAVRTRWFLTSALVLFYLALVVYLERAQYEYGEHKVLQLVGPMWTALLVVRICQTVSQKGGRTWRKLLAFSLLLVLALLSANFMLKAHAALVKRIPERSLTLTFDDAIVGRVRPGDEVIIDRSAVLNTDRFIKQDYATLLAHLRNAQVALSGRVDASIPSHTQLPRLDSFRNVHSPDWLIKIKSASLSSVLNTNLPTTASSPREYDLVRLDGNDPVVLSRSGWHPCEQGHCWTMDRYELEAFVPAQCRSQAGRQAVLEIEQVLHAPPTQGLVVVSINGEAVERVPSASAGRILLPLPDGWSTISVAPDWPVVSPHDIGTSPDPRPLFAALVRVNATCRKQVTP